MKFGLLFSLALISITAPAQSTEVDYQKRAVELFPEIGKAGSVANRRFLEAVAAARIQRPELFKNPEWPLTIAKEIDRGGESKGDPFNGIRGLSDQKQAARTGTNSSPDSVNTLEFAVQSQNVSELIKACETFDHGNTAFRAQVVAFKGQLLEIQKALTEAQQWSQRVAPEIARLRKNAKVSDRPNPLIKDGSNQERAQAQRNQADNLEEDARERINLASTKRDELFALMREFIVKVRDTDREEQAMKVRAAQEQEQKRSELEKLKGIQEFFASLDEPEGKPEFSEKEGTPSYGETLDFINAKLLQKEWRLRYGTRSKKFILVHPRGAYFFHLSTLNSGVKFTTDDGLHFIQLEVSLPDATMKSIDREGKGETEVRKISIPCEDKFDSEKLAKAFRHLIKMAGGKDDPF